MAFVPVSNVFEAEIRMQYFEQRVENTLYFQAETALSSANLAAFGGELVTWWTDFMAPKLSDELTLREVFLTDLTTATSAVATVVPPTPVPGEITGNSLPGNVAFVVSFRTEQRGRSFRGRNYVVGIPASVQLGNQISEEEAADLVAAYNELIGIAAAGALVWSVVSRYSGIDPVTGKPIPRVAGIATPITAVLAVDTNLDSQRNRLTGRGT